MGIYYNYNCGIGRVLYLILKRSKYFLIQITKNQDKWLRDNNFYKIEKGKFLDRIPTRRKIYISEDVYRKLSKMK